MSDRGKWSAHKACLVEEGLLSPLFIQLDDITFTTTGSLTFDPLLIAEHSQRLGELLDRCLSIRKDIRELEVLAVKAATDYKLFVRTSAIDEQMDFLRLQVESKIKEQTGFQNAASAFGKAQPLETGLTEIALGLDASLAEDLTTARKLEPLIRSRWEILRDYQDAYHERHCEPGNAHNYGQRATLLLGVLDVLLDEGLARASALAAGIRSIYGTEITDVPTSVMLKTVDEFAMWALRTIRALSRAAEQETDFEIVIPLVQPWFSSEPLIQQSDFDDIIKKAAPGQPLELPPFKIPANDFLNERSRLRGIGISFGNDFHLTEAGIDQNETADSFTRITLKISPPRNDETTDRPDVLICNVGLHGASAMSLVQGSVVNNLSPIGEWKIVIHPLLVFKNGEKRLLSTSDKYTDAVRDFKLALRFYVPGIYTPIPFHRQERAQKTPSA
ncbi:hypothetical protein ELH24_21775 [Rhizobium ruizarguesonis]|uniref:hypothetical protein n=1 Tax=Rhizobium ruizarguesonis TaxID=2081791 RepID=UPI0010320EB0|nr:hypothetical protein [Rhizobium ruizarguesonis]TBD01835.1 hypothetical protein ELH25_25495 [Rhizobium ruizarguesonis]TBD17981.1 hypothetical protein ELH24_21775 [Rhizobium ruizarguesonis]TBE99224.1 hypothetical protein ELG98_22890 [Rhizobium ruizarguesonis]